MASIGLVATVTRDEEVLSYRQVCTLQQSCPRHDNVAGSGLSSIGLIITNDELRTRSIGMPKQSPSKLLRSHGPSRHRYLASLLRPRSSTQAHLESRTLQYNIDSRFEKFETNDQNRTEDLILADRGWRGHFRGDACHLAVTQSSVIQVHVANLAVPAVSQVLPYANDASVQSYIRQTAKGR
jgi:hypothetical protein